MADTLRLHVVLICYDCFVKLHLCLLCGHGSTDIGDILYGKLYSGKSPELIDGDVFRIVVPLDDSYSFDEQLGKAENNPQNKAQFKAQNKAQSSQNNPQNMAQTQQNDPQFKAQNKAQFKAQNKAQLKRENDGALADDYALIATSITGYLLSHPEATQAEIAKAIKKSRRTIQNAITELKKQGLIEREGARKNGRWIVKQK
jgi:ATP-dependent DNA helicase RecG